MTNFAKMIDRPIEMSNCPLEGHKPNGMRTPKAPKVHHYNNKNKAQNFRVPL